ncbi:MAG TPA: adenosine kinase [Spirochaetota bacterium]|nr:adenosine kinase [Spirochaetota bacterium]HPU89967.1 adenosine kinase [Spirochaetota bacterium]
MISGTTVSNKSIDVAGIGSALVDFTVSVDDATLARLGLEKGRMQLVDAAQSAKILAALAGLPLSRTPGGSAANTMAGVAALGGASFFMGTIGADEYGEFYIEATERAGVRTGIDRLDHMTGHAITFITPDSERTFATHLGASLFLTRRDIDAAAIAKSSVLHIEGYLLESEGQKDACLYAMQRAREAGTLVSLDLSDSSLIGRNLDSFRALVREHADIVFVNEDEAQAFTGESPERALEAIAAMCRIAVVKIGAEGSLVKHDGAVHRIPSFKTNVANTNGAGDMYAAGLLYGITHGYSVDKAGLIGSYASSLVVASHGARLSEKLDVSSIV